MLTFAAVEGGTVGIGALAAALVTVTGYMLWDRRDTDKRVDKATQTVIDALTDQRDQNRARAERCEAEAERARRQRADLRAELNGVYDERNAALARAAAAELRVAELEGDHP